MLPAWRRKREYVTYEARSVPRYHPCSTQRPSTHGRLITGQRAPLTQSVRDVEAFALKSAWFYSQYVFASLYRYVSCIAQRKENRIYCWYEGWLPDEEKRPTTQWERMLKLAGWTGTIRTFVVAYLTRVRGAKPEASGRLNRVRKFCNIL